MRDAITQKRYDPAKDILLLDGIPRNMHQVQLLEPDIDVLKVLNLAADNEEQLVERLRKRAVEQHREDDAAEDVIRHRLQVYHEETSPMLSHFPADIVERIDAMSTVEEVRGTIFDVMIPLRDARLGKND